MSNVPFNFINSHFSTTAENFTKTPSESDSKIKIKINVCHMGGGQLFSAIKSDKPLVPR